MAVAMIFIALLALKLSLVDVPTPGHWIPRQKVTGMLIPFKRGRAPRELT